MSVRIAVTGATGNVGTAIVSALSGDPAVEEVVGIARRTPELQVPKVRWAAADVADDDLRPLLEGVSAVIHLAWMIQPSRKPAVLEDVNVVGTGRVVRAAAEAGVGAFVHASSVGTYSPAPKDRTVDERWPNAGVVSSTYSRQKAAAERVLDEWEDRVRIVRIRPGLIFHREAAAEIARIFLGPFVPRSLLRPELLKLLPAVPGLRAQVVHADDVADAYRRAALGDAHGAFNIAADPPVDAPTVARWLGGRTFPLPRAVLRAAVDASWRARLQPTEPGWIDLALSAPIMDTSRARAELGWQPTRSAEQCLREVLGGLVDTAGTATAPLHPGHF